MWAAWLMCSIYFVRIEGSTDNCGNCAKILSNFNNYGQWTLTTIILTLYVSVFFNIVSNSVLANISIRTEALVVRLYFVYYFV